MRHVVGHLLEENRVTVYSIGFAHRRAFNLEFPQFGIFGNWHQDIRVILIGELFSHNFDIFFAQFSIFHIFPIFSQICEI